jgi:hypothetical protein
VADDYEHVTVRKAAGNWRLHFVQRWANDRTSDPSLQHFNGAAPITEYSSVLTSAPIDEIHWDNSNHLYALSDSTCKLYVYTITPTSITPVAGSPYTVSNPNALIVVPK